jgi:hypothetical protein
MARRTAKGPSSPAWLRGYPRGALAVALLACFIGLTGPSAARSESAMLDLSRAVVVMPEALTGPERKAVELLVEDVARRSGIRWKVLSRWPAEPVPVVAIGSSSAARAFPGPIAEFFGAGTRPRPAEGYRIRTEAKGPAVLVAGNDARGVLFGVGRLLRELRTTQGRVLLPSGFQLETVPRYPLRGHQLGYRPKTNSYDGWDLHSSLAGFGSRAVWPQAWCQNAQTLHDAPLLMRYDRLDGKARYKVRVVYAGDSFRNLIRLDAGEHQVHDWFKKPDPPVPVEFDVPAPATADGTLTLTWRQEPGKGANGRGCQVAEVWLIRK